MWLTLLLCLEQLDGGLHCAPMALPYPLPSLVACNSMANVMVRLQVLTPPEHRWVKPPRPCTRYRPPWPVIPIMAPGGQFA